MQIAIPIPIPIPIPMLTFWASPKFNKELVKTLSIICIFYLRTLRGDTVN